jgi:Fe-Mn family superoxide dismutase
MTYTRRKFILNTGLLTIGTFVSGSLIRPVFGTSGNLQKAGPATFSLPALPYAYDALEPFIDNQTMEIHHTKHHQAYVDNLNKALAESDFHGTLDELQMKISSFPSAVRNNGGGHWNHSFFWKLMKSNADGVPGPRMTEVINNSFESFDNFKTKFEDAAMKRFGSGWAWLVVSPDKKLSIGSTPNQDNPLMDVSEIKGTPILAVDVWEHAYYLKHQNKRAEYLKTWWSVVNWGQVESNYLAIK